MSAVTWPWESRLGQLPVINNQHLLRLYSDHFISFSAAACIISELKDARTRLQTICSGPITHLLSILWIFMKIFHMPERKRKRKTWGFQISHFYWSFSSDTRAVKGLNIWKTLTHLVHAGYFGCFRPSSTEFLTWTTGSLACTRMCIFAKCIVCTRGTLVYGVIHKTFVESAHNLSAQKTSGWAQISLTST